MTNTTATVLNDLYSEFEDNGYFGSVDRVYAERTFTRSKEGANTTIVLEEAPGKITLWRYNYTHDDRQIGAAESEVVTDKVTDAARALIVRQ